ncbi:hypothetical protein VNI00_004454 [Paramarasmius palmivorus]|uniref:Uncharacterized protein n=1 Tax=Paramarasmius palmivorus TaxID=297713 RepID=A0AAW0DJB8_9AGAR
MSYGGTSTTLFSGIRRGLMLNTVVPKSYRLGATQLQSRHSRAYSPQASNWLGMVGGPQRQHDGDNTSKETESCGLCCFIRLALGLAIPWTSLHYERKSRPLHEDRLWMANGHRYMPHILRWTALAHSENIFQYFDKETVLDEQLNTPSWLFEIYEKLFRPLFDPEDPKTEIMFNQLRAFEDVSACNKHGEDNRKGSEALVEKEKESLRRSIRTIVGLVAATVRREQEDATYHDVLWTCVIHYEASTTIPASLSSLHDSCPSCARERQDLEKKRQASDLNLDHTTDLEILRVKVMAIRRRQRRSRSKEKDPSYERIMPLAGDTIQTLLLTLNDIAAYTSVPYLSDASSLALGILQAVQQCHSNKTDFITLAEKTCELVLEINETCKAIVREKLGNNFSDFQELTSDQVQGHFTPLLQQHLKKLCGIEPSSKSTTFALANETSIG